MNRINYLVCFLFAFFCWGYLFAETRSPHDEEIYLVEGEDEFVVRSKCHGYSNIQTRYGEPDSGKHNLHIALLDDFNYRDSFLNGSYYFDGSLDKNRDGKNDINNVNNRTWDICDECHAESTPSLDSGFNEDHLLFKAKKVAIREANEGSWDSFEGTCSNLKYECHPFAIFRNREASWGDPSNEDPLRYYEHEYKEQNCLVCHTFGFDMSRDQRKTMLFSDSYNEMCEKCHGEYKHNEVKVKHPYNNILPDRFLENIENAYDFSEKYLFPLEDDEKMTCVTCHNPHGSSCKSCHYG